MTLADYPVVHFQRGLVTHVASPSHDRPLVKGMVWPAKDGLTLVYKWTNAAGAQMVQHTVVDSDRHARVTPDHMDAVIRIIATKVEEVVTYPPCEASD